MNVLITGAAGGLGRAFAVECAKRGYNMLLTDINGAGLDAIKHGLLCQYKATVHTFPCDITIDASVSSMMEYAQQNNIFFDMLLNVAGVDFEGGFTMRHSKQILDIVKLNIEGTLRVTHAALNMRRKNSRFYIIFVSSLASMYPIPLKSTYAASKRFLLDFSIALECELKPEKVSVLSLCPGGLCTTDEAMNGIISQGFWGNATTNRLEAVSHHTITRALRGYKLYVPGIVNRTFSILGKLVPARMAAKLLYRRWIRAQKKWLVT